MTRGASTDDSSSANDIFCLDCIADYLAVDACFESYLLDLWLDL